METSDVKSEFERVSCYKCPKCEFVSLEEIAITDHLNEQHRDPIRNETQQNVIIFHCLYYIFIKVWLSGFNTKNFIFVIFSKQKPITKKKIRKTIPNGKLKCDIGDCPVSLIQPENIEYHKLCHSPENKFKCPECEEIFSRWKVVLLHLWKCHSIDIELFSCTLCDYKSSKSELLKFHMETHSSERPCLCDLCGKGFKNMKQMRNHRDLHSTGNVKRNTARPKVRTYLCNFCGHNTTSQSSLKIHLRQHTGEKPFSCSECNYSTGDHNSLRRHRMKHSGEKKYKCPHCDYASIQSSTFKVHLRSKHPESSEQLIFACELCTFQTVRKESLELHNSTAH